MFFIVLLWAATAAQAFPTLGTQATYRNTSSSAVPNVHSSFSAGHYNGKSDPNSSSGAPSIHPPISTGYSAGNNHQNNSSAVSRVHPPFATGYSNRNGSAVPSIHPPYATGYSYSNITQNNSTSRNISRHADHPTVSPSPTEDGRNRFGFKGEQTATFTKNGPTATLSPNIHWSWDTKDVRNIEPIPSSQGSQMYYGAGDPSKAGHFAFLTYHFTSPSVNLDHSERLRTTYDRKQGLKIKFADDEAFKLAIDTWAANSGLILIAFAPGCGDYHKGERCYFKVSDLDVKKDELVINASGKSKHPDEIITFGETEWGWWTPSDSRRSQNGPPTTAPGTSFSGGPTSTSFPAPSSASKTSVLPSSRPFANNSADFAASNCDGGLSDNRYGLLTACLGPEFDLDLDRSLGYTALNAESREFLEGISPHLGSRSAPTTNHRRTIERRSFWSKITDGWNKFTGAVKNTWNKFTGAVKDAWNKVTTGVKEGWEWLQKNTVIGGSIEKEMQWKIPDPGNPNSDSNKLRDKDAKQAESPWGDSILLKSFGHREASEKKYLDEYLNIYCVECGVSGSARIAGRARWTPFGGFLEGQVEINTDIKFSLKIGIDAQMVWSQEFNMNLVRVGLPGLSYGVITIGPWVSVGTRVELAVGAQGSLLAGAEMGLENAMALIDFVNPKNTKSSGWKPYFRPVFEAQGELSISATLALPIGLECGLSIATWQKSIALIDEPSITGVAQVAASAKINEDGKFEAGFLETDGCFGISTQISWRNRLFVNILDIDEITLLDTEDITLAKGCIKFPSPKPELEATPVNASQAATKLMQSNSTNSTPKLMLPNSTLTATEPLRSNSTHTAPQPLRSNSTHTTPEPQRSNSTHTAPEPLRFNSTHAATGPLRSNSTNDEPGFIHPDSAHDASASMYSVSASGTPKSTMSPSTNSVKLASSVDAPKAKFPNSTRTNGATEHTFFKSTHMARTPGSLSTLPGKRSIESPSQANGSRSSDISSESNFLTYAVQPLPDTAYSGSSGLGFAPLVDPADATMILSCSNGSAIAVPSGQRDEECSSSWAAVGDNKIVHDGVGRIMHYYNDTMSKVGVSRLRVSVGTMLPSTGVVVALVPRQSIGGLEDYYYVAVDPHGQIFYPLVCDFADGTASKVFLTKDPVVGVNTLQSMDVVYAITGGKVDRCHNLAMNHGTLAA